MYKRLFPKRHAVLAALLALLPAAALAMPAKKGIITYTMPNGEQIEVRMHGDEFHHYYTTTDGYVLLRADDGTFTYARTEDSRLVDTRVRATNVDSRSSDVQAMLRTIDRAASVEAEALVRQRVARKRAPRFRASASNSYESRLSTFPKTGSPRVLVLLVEFSDKKFTLPNPHQAFENQLNQPGYSESGATGSILDYFTDSSNGQFTPQFDLYGPVTLPRPMSYYGGNDQSGNDLHPADMVTDACALVDDQIDFSVYDNDHDGVVDNVYIFYAGYGEADGGPAASIWPHSWDLSEAYSQTFTFDGVRVNHYACSNELRDGQGSVVAGIGSFCHEFGHVLGLPDLYSTNYSSAFTPGNWSIMDHGSYNNQTRTPPLYTAYERYCMNWVSPTILEDPCNVTMRSVTHIGHYDDVYMIKTPKDTEYYLLENRQQQGWDTYIPSHGMLVWHIDFVPDVWNMNICNVSKQYIDIVEADNDASSYSIAGDPFPGSAGVTSFTDETVPSMKTWDGVKLYAPITEIKEQNGIISFMFKGGQDIFDPVVANAPLAVKAGSFTASWNKVNAATGYLLTVYKVLPDGTQELDAAYDKIEVGNVESYEVTGLTPETHYAYEVRATNGKFFSKASNQVTLTTLEPTIDFKRVETLSPSDVSSTSFVAHWEPLPEAESYSLNVYTLQLGTPFSTKEDFTGNTLAEGWTSDSKTFDSRSAYSSAAPSLRLADGQCLQSPAFSQDVRGLSFWYRGNTASEGNTITISGLSKSGWVEIDKIAPVRNTAGGILYQNSEIPAGYSQVKLVFSRQSTGYAYVDDVTVYYGGNKEELPLRQYTGLQVGNVTSFRVEGLTPGTTYNYSVFAHQGDLRSIESQRVGVTLSLASGLDGVSQASRSVVPCQGGFTVTSDQREEVRVYDAQGRLVDSFWKESGTAMYHLGQRGLFVVVTRDGAAKVVLR